MKRGTESSVSLSRASATRTKANRADVEALQLRTLDAVEFNAAFDAYLTATAARSAWPSAGFAPGYRAAFNAWLATKPRNNPDAPRGPAYTRQYVVPRRR